MPKTKNKQRGISKARQQKTKNRKLLGISLIVLLITVSVTIAVLVLNPSNKKPEDEKSEEPETVSTEEKTDEKKEETSATKTPTKDEKPETNKTPVSYEGENANDYETLTGTLSFIGYGDNGKFLVLPEIDQSLESGGTCELTMISSATGKILLTKKSKVISSVSTSECQDFGIKNSEVPPGKYKISIKITGSNKVGVIEETEEIKN